MDDAQRLREWQIAEQVKRDQEIFQEKLRQLEEARKAQEAQELNN